jgi:hypothetical protein
MREEVQAAAAAHRDLGPGYDAAVAEGLVERIGEEIDRRVDARLFGQLPRPQVRTREVRAVAPGRVSVSAVILALGSMGLAVGATAAVLHPASSSQGVSAGQGILIALIWLVVAAINLGYARRQ